MKTIYYIIGFVSTLLGIVAILIFVAIFLAKKEAISENITIALIAALSTIITITGSIFTNRFLTNEQLRKEKEMEFLKIKREFYHEYLGYFLIGMAYHNAGLMWTNEAKENEKNLLLLKMRLPLYSSQEIVEYFEKSYTGQAGFSELFTLIRKDLMNSNLSKFDDLAKISIHLPNIVIDSSIQSQLDQMKLDYEKFKKSELFSEFVKIITDGSIIIGIQQNNENHITLNKLRMEKVIDFRPENNVFILSLRGNNYLNLYKMDQLYSK
jgi:hypothetical protein